MDGHYQMSLGEIIDALEAINEPEWEEADGGKKHHKDVEFDFGWARPVGLHSWRGSYEELAICFDLGGYAKRGPEQPRMNHKEFLTMLKDAIGKTFEGWKGGDFEMDRDTPVWVAGHHGDNCNTVITKITEEGFSTIILHTAYCEY